MSTKNLKVLLRLCALWEVVEQAGIHRIQGSLSPPVTALSA